MSPRETPSQRRSDEFAVEMSVVWTTTARVPLSLTVMEAPASFEAARFFRFGEILTVEVPFGGPSPKCRYLQSAVVVGP